MPLKLIAQITFAIIGLTTALFVSNIVLTSPTLPVLNEITKLPEIKLPDLSYLLPKVRENKQSNFATLLVSPTPRPMITKNPLVQPKTTAIPGLPSPALPILPDATEISDTDINKLISTMTPAEAPVKYVKVSFTDGKILLTGKLTKPIEGEFTAEAGVSLIDGVPVIKLTKAALGSLPIPTFLLGSLETAANEAIKSALSSQNIFKVKKLEIKNGKIVFSGQIK